MAALSVYVRHGCHLCDDMLWGLREFQQDCPFEFDVVDIQGDAALEDRYGRKVPVLVDEAGQELCHFFLDRQRLEAYFRR